jgi:undecaprenyl diphosphate synthase
MSRCLTEVWKKWFGRTDQQSEKAFGDLDPARVPRHVAIIMDGNGRWAQKRGLPRTFGHRAGAEALRAIVRTTAELGIGVLTTYAFSTENWKRPAEEVDLLMNLFSDYLDNEIDELNENGIRVRFSGKTDELAPGLKAKIDRAEGITAANAGLVLNIAVNYGGRAEITRAMQLIAAEVAAGSLKPGDVSEETIGRHLYTAGLPDPDLLIRPAGDQRISNFLLWQAAYAEFWFTDINWPDFRPEHLIAAVADFQRRDRRFGGLTK